MKVMAMAASAAMIGISAARSPRKMKNSATSKIGNASRLARTRSFSGAVMLSAMAPAAPPTLTCAPGTAPAAWARIVPTAMFWVIMLAPLSSETTMRLL
jgi:hypothetical protein